MTYDGALHFEESMFFCPQISTITNNPTLLQQGGTKQMRNVSGCLLPRFTVFIDAYTSPIIIS